MPRVGPDVAPVKLIDAYNNATQNSIMSASKECLYLKRNGA